MSKNSTHSIRSSIFFFLPLIWVGCGGSKSISPADQEGPATMNGFTMFPADNPWNTDISVNTVHPMSAEYVASIGIEVGLHPDFGTEWNGAPNGIPFMLVDSTTPLVDVVFDYDEESDPGPWPIPLHAPIEGGPQGDGDRHVLLLDTTKGVLYEMWRAFPPGHSENPNAEAWYAGSGAVFNLRSNQLRPAGYTSADAAGLPILPGLIRYDEVVEKGEIRHALRFTAARTQRAYIAPATHQAGASDNADLPPMGLRMRLKAAFDTAGFSSEVRVILQALKTYGMFLADNGSNWYLSGAPDPRWSDENLAELRRVRGSDFEAVYTGDLER